MEKNKKDNLMRLNVFIDEETYDWFEEYRKEKKIKNQAHGKGKVAEELLIKVKEKMNNENDFLPKYKTINKDRDFKKINLFIGEDTYNWFENYREFLKGKGLLYGKGIVLNELLLIAKSTERNKKKIDINEFENFKQKYWNEILESITPDDLEKIINIINKKYWSNNKRK